MQHGAGLKFFLAITAIFLVGVIGYFTLFLIPQNFYSTESNISIEEAASTEEDLSSQDDITWVSYRNEELGFETIYPEDFKAETYKNIAVNQVHFEPKDEERRQKGYRFSVDYYESESEGIFNCPSHTDDLGKVSINGTVADKCGFEDFADTGRNHWIVKTVNNENKYYFVCQVYREMGDICDTILSNLKFIESVDTSDWQTYRNDELGVEFNYPPELGEVTDDGSNAIYTNTFEFTPRKTPDYIYLNIFTDESVEEFDQAINDALEAGQAIGDPGTLSYPLSVKSFLVDKPLDYDCTQGFEPYLQAEQNESCTIIDVNNFKAFKIIAKGPFQSEVVEIKYLFYENEVWFDFGKRISTTYPVNRLFKFEDLNNILSGIDINTDIQEQIKEFEDIILTVKFTN